jgi:predicted Zn-dependent protease
LLADHRTDKASLDRANSLALLLTKSDVPQFKDTVGWVAYQRADYTTAMSLLEQVVATLPNNPMVHYHLGMTYLAAGQISKAPEQFKIARDLAPNDADLKIKLDAALKSYSDKVKG